MGEYARYGGDQIKIGTCEDMYYLRFDQRHKVTAQSGNVDPVKDATQIRFRFPFPDEDAQAPGDFDDYGRSVRAYGFDGGPDDAEHGMVQFKADVGYLVSLPCPEGGSYTGDMSIGPRVLPGVVLGANGGLNVHRNAFQGGVHLVQQKLLADGRLIPILTCKSCGALWRLEDPDRIMALAVGFRSEGDRKQQEDDRERARRGESSSDTVGLFYHGIADRILAGAGLAITAVDDAAADVAGDMAFDATREDRMFGR